MNKLLAVIVRQASDDFWAFKTACAMQSMDSVEVISVVCQPIDPIIHGGEKYFWHVYAKYDPSQHSPEEIDAVIDEAMAQ